MRAPTPPRKLLQRLPGLNTLVRAFLKQLSPEQRAELVSRAGTSARHLGFVDTALSNPSHRDVGLHLAVRIEHATRDMRKEDGVTPLVSREKLCGICYLCPLAREANDPPEFVTDEAAERSLEYVRLSGRDIKALQRTKITGRGADYAK